MSGELLPCPFCGGEAKRVTIEEKGDNFGGDVIACTGICGASSHVEFGRKENLVSLWNTRMTTQQDSVDVERLRAAITDAIGKADAAFGYSFNLTRLVDGEETHTLTMPGHDRVDFDDRDEGYALIAERRNRARADAVLTALSLPITQRDEQGAMAWFGSQRRLSLFFYSPMYGDDDDQSEEWRVQRESGPINDREWDTVGRGNTPLAAICAARLSIEQGDQDGGEG